MTTLRNCHNLATDFHEIDSPFAPVIDFILESTNSPDYLVVNLELLLDAAKLDRAAHTPPDPRRQIQQAMDPRPRGQNVAYQPCDVDEYCNEFDAGPAIFRKYQ